MPRYFFDVHHGMLSRDHEGSECANPEAVRQQAILSLAEIAKELIPRGGDHQAFLVLVRDEKDSIVYIASLNYNGTWFDKSTTDRR
ncbi:DUF6894 family protein [Methylobacterium nodulans]|uniref:DUF6894 domain-containing protein n=1 Tax=Methylobacterium nodulans (strain LMG 21967 / CNCM I-2342 / ORS 2060) TaxID=460265 RepID=B8II87_METNO|nr:hypothetical protein [Methylobacterium nodulans]ACL57956.1 conserved hypothetical protein [Methylobacterium nodulans ORS 2060]